MGFARDSHLEHLTTSLFITDFFTVFFFPQYFKNNYSRASFNVSNYNERQKVVETLLGNDAFRYS